MRKISEYSSLPTVMDHAPFDERRIQKHLSEPLGPRASNLTDARQDENAEKRGFEEESVGEERQEAPHPPRRETQQPSSVIGAEELSSGEGSVSSSISNIKLATASIRGRTGFVFSSRSTAQSSSSSGRNNSFISGSRSIVIRSRSTASNSRVAAASSSVECENGFVYTNGSAVASSVSGVPSRITGPASVLLGKATSSLTPSLSKTRSASSSYLKKDQSTAASFSREDKNTPFPNSQSVVPSSPCNLETAGGPDRPWPGTPPKRREPEFFPEHNSRSEHVPGDAGSASAGVVGSTSVLSTIRTELELLGMSTETALERGELVGALARAREEGKASAGGAPPAAAGATNDVEEGQTSKLNATWILSCIGRFLCGSGANTDAIASMKGTDSDQRPSEAECGIDLISASSHLVVLDSSGRILQKGHRDGSARENSCEAKSLWPKQRAGAADAASAAISLEGGNWAALAPGTATWRYAVAGRWEHAGDGGWGRATGGDSGRRYRFDEATIEIRWEDPQADLAGGADGKWEDETDEEADVQTDDVGGGAARDRREDGPTQGMQASEDTEVTREMSVSIMNESQNLKESRKSQDANSLSRIEFTDRSIRRGESGLIGQLVGGCSAPKEVVVDLSKHIRFRNSLTMLLASTCSVRDDLLESGKVGNGIINGRRLHREREEIQARKRILEVGARVNQATERATAEKMKWIGVEKMEVKSKVMEAKRIRDKAERPAKAMQQELEKGEEEIAQTERHEPESFPEEQCPRSDPVHSDAGLGSDRAVGLTSVLSTIRKELEVLGMSTETALERGKLVGALARAREEGKASAGVCPSVASGATNNGKEHEASESNVNWIPSCLRSLLCGSGANEGGIASINGTDSNQRLSEAGCGIGLTSGSSDLVVLDSSGQILTKGYISGREDSSEVRSQNPEWRAGATDAAVASGLNSVVAPLLTTKRATQAPEAGSWRYDVAGRWNHAGYGGWGYAAGGDACRRYCFDEATIEVRWDNLPMDPAGRMNAHREDEDNEEAYVLTNGINGNVSRDRKEEEPAEGRRARVDSEVLQVASVAIMNEGRNSKENRKSRDTNSPLKSEFADSKRRMGENSPIDQYVREGNAPQDVVVNPSNCTRVGDSLKTLHASTSFVRDDLLVSGNGGDRINNGRRFLRQRDDERQATKRALKIRAHVNQAAQRTSDEKMRQIRAEKMKSKLKVMEAKRMQAEDECSASVLRQEIEKRESEIKRRSRRLEKQLWRIQREGRKLDQLRRARWEEESRSTTQARSQGHAHAASSCNLLLPSGSRNTFGNMRGSCSIKSGRTV